MSRIVWIRLPDFLDDAAASAGVTAGHIVQAAADALASYSIDAQVEVIEEACAKMKDAKAIDHGMALPTPSLLIAAAQRISVCRALLEGGHLKTDERPDFIAREKAALEQLREQLRALGLEAPQPWKTRALTEDEVRALLEEGRKVRADLEARASRMQQIDPRDAERKAR